MTELTEPHTASYIKKIFLAVIESYGISLKQVFTITTDNGSNMLKSVQLLSEKSEISSNDDIFIVDSDLEETTSILEEDSAIFSDLDIDEIQKTAFHQDTELLTDLVDISFNLESNNKSISSIRCSAHTIQLVVIDVCKLPEFKGIIGRIRYVVKKLRSTVNSRILTKFDQRKCILDSTTRWSSTYNMILRLQELKNFIIHKDSPVGFINLSDSDWKFCEDYIKVFKHFFYITNTLQSSQLLIGELYAIYLELENKISILSVLCDLGYQANKYLLIRKNKILQCEYIFSGVYLDPRYK